MLRFLHAADLHLGSPFRLSSERASSAPFEGATFRTFSTVVSLAISERVDGVLLAGDLYDRADRSLRARLHLVKELERLHAAGINSFVVHGNHDPLSADPRGLVLPPSVTVFGASHHEVVVPGEGGAPRYRVQGISYLEADTRDDLSARFSRRGPEPTIAVLHANLSGQAEHLPYAPCTLEGLSARGLDYWALGHVHTAAIHALSRGALAVYPGNPQGRHLKELGPRHVALVELDEGAAEGGRLVRARLVAVDSVRWHRLQVSVTGLTGLNELVQAAREQIDLAVDLAAHVEGHVVQLDLVGRGPLHAQLATPAARAELEASLRQDVESARLVLAGVSDGSAPLWRPEALLDAGGLVAEVARLLTEPLSSAAVGELLQEPELQALEHVLAAHGLPSLASQGAALVEAAARQAVDLLVETDA